ncbi:hypothetical protein RHMOL_Rhmol04G0032400 [Rhododendron molle]|uniref:Uncharacterized protein n=1 Tax=Rhododendron molle TaxID=49168 RepID=A0ACC0NXP8_RHOML|nr:hypothetical protein RHMOL_Rhmol04G0032400 [Rhododendron molle]
MQERVKERSVHSKEPVTTVHFYFTVLRGNYSTLSICLVVLQVLLISVEAFIFGYTQDTRSAGGVGSAVSFSDDEDTTQFTRPMSASRGRKGSTVPFRPSHDSEEVGNASRGFDGIYRPGRQCIVGTDFGSFVTHYYECFIHFCIGNLSILLFRGSAGPEAEATQFSTLEAVKA